MHLQLFRKRTVWLPTFFGWAVLALVFGTAGAWWWFKAEAFLSLTERQPAEVLVVEGWIGGDGIAEAKAEYDRGGYTYVVATSGKTGAPWEKRRWTFAIEAQEQLIRMGIPSDHVILAIPKDTEDKRTYEAALAVMEALRAQKIHPHAINVFTLGPHARRSRMVYAKVAGQTLAVGVISWAPPGYDTGPWWHSSERATDLIKETVGWLYELLLNSGRMFSK